MTVYGSTSGVEVTTQGGGISNVVVGIEQKVVVFGHGDPDAGTASTNDPTQIVRRSDASTKFGEGSPLAEGIRETIENGASREFVYGVMPDEITVTAETVTGGSGVLANVPIVEDETLITITDVTTGDDITPVFDYTSPPSQASAGEANINPNSSEIEDDGTGNDLEVSYEYLDWQTALDAADNVLNREETGTYITITESENVVSSLVSKIDPLRTNEYKMIRGVAAAEPNNISEQGQAWFDTANYSDNVDHDAMFMHAPTRLDGQTKLITPGIGGLFGGNALNDPVYDDQIRGYDAELAQQITNADETNLRSENIMPVSNDGSIELAGNGSTSTEVDWERDYFTRRVVDQVILIAKAIGDTVIGKRNTQQRRMIAREEIKGELEGLVADGLLRPNEDEEERWYVEVTADDQDQNKVNIELGVTPVGVVKSTGADIIINTAT